MPVLRSNKSLTENLLSRNCSWVDGREEAVQRYKPENYTGKRGDMMIISYVKTNKFIL